VQTFELIKAVLGVNVKGRRERKRERESMTENGNHINSIFVHFSSSSFHFWLYVTPFMRIKCVCVGFEHA
jgi:hypothetical protein